MRRSANVDCPVFRMWTWNAILSC